MTSVPSHRRKARVVAPDDPGLVRLRAEPDDIYRCLGCGVWHDTLICDGCAPWYELDKPLS